VVGLANLRRHRDPRIGIYPNKHENRLGQIVKI
jgi:hypothetical protein